MGKIMKYKAFESFNMYGSKLISESNFLELANKECKNWQSSKTELFRGQPDLGEYIYTDPTKFYRRSIEDVNLHIELLDNLPSWKEYPKYSQSIIGISSKEGADGYGDEDRATYELIPYDNIKIAVCPEPNIWESFGYWGEYICETLAFFDEIGIDPEIWYQSANDTIETKLKSIDNVYNLIPVEDNMLVGGEINRFLDMMVSMSNLKKEKITGEDCFNFLNDNLFNPKARGFKLLTYGKNFEIPLNKQIWTNGPVLLRKVS